MAHLLYFLIDKNIDIVLSDVDDRGCKCRKAAGEESPGSIEQGAR